MTALRRYALPAIVTIVAYGLLGIGFDFVEERFAAGLVCTVLTAYFIRFCDDLSDLDEDTARGRALLGKKTLIILAVASVLGIACISIASSLPILLAPTAVISAQFLIKKQFRDIIKPLFLPSVLIVLFNTVFVYNSMVIVLCVACVIIDAVMILHKRNSK